MSMRIGNGYDVHRLETGRPLVLGGIDIPHSKGLLGHSDADAVLHAIADALLGALALGDIGELFPDTDAQYKNADSSQLIGVVMRQVQKRGYHVVNLDINLLCEAPKIQPFKTRMRESIASLLNTTIQSVSVKPRTGEGLGPVGRGEAIEVHCVVLLSDER